MNLFLSAPKKKEYSNPLNRWANNSLLAVAAETLTISAEENTYVENSAIEAITVYPNPANEVIYVDNTTGEQIVSISIR